jgi:uncharacterized protein HemY
MKKLFFLLTFLVMAVAVIACPVCSQQQPKILRGISHGAGPESNWDLLIVTGMALVVVATLFFSILFLYKPGEQAAAHIKHSILNAESYGS